jgi:hypothetical protein
MHRARPSMSKKFHARPRLVPWGSRRSRALLALGAASTIALAAVPSAGQQRRGKAAAQRLGPAGVRIEVDAATMDAVARLGGDVVFFTSRSKPLRNLGDITDRGEQVGVWGVELFGKVNRLLDAAGVPPSTSGQDASMLIGDALFPTLFQDSPTIRLFATHAYSDGREQAIVQQGGGVRLSFRSREKPAASAATSAGTGPSKSLSVVYSGTTRCAGTFVTVSFIVDGRRQVSHFKADHGCVGEQPSVSREVASAASLDGDGRFRTDDTMGGSVSGVVSAASASGGLANLMQLQCRSDGRFRKPCETWSARPEGDAGSVLAAAAGGQSAALSNTPASGPNPESLAPPPYTLPPDYSKWNESGESAATRERLAYRMQPRLTAHLMLTRSRLHEEALSATGGSLALGYRRNWFQRAGFYLRVGAGAANVRVDGATDARGKEVADSSACVLYEGTAELVPYAVPFGRFYLGPILWLAYRSFAPSHFIVADQTYVMRNGWLGGIGLDLGLLALAREQLDIDLRLKTSFNGDVPFRAEIGLGWHFLP